MPQDLYDEMQAQIVNQKDEIREHISKNMTLNEDLERIEEQYNDTKTALGERTNQLKKTTETLVTTEKHLVEKKVECTETKYLLGEQVSTEERLWMEADDLQKKTIEQNEEACRLYRKLAHVNQVNSHNQALTEQFTEHIMKKIMGLTKRDMGLSLEHTNSLCNVCDALSEAANHMEDLKSENTCQLNLFEEKQKNWLHLQQRFVNA